MSDIPDNVFFQRLGFKVSLIDDELWLPVSDFNKARQKLDQYYADFYRNKIPEEKYLDDFPTDYEDGWNDCIADITAQFNKGDSDV